MVLPASHRISRVPWYSGSQLGLYEFRIQDFHLLWLDFPDHSATHSAPLCCVRNPEINLGLGSSPFARRYLGNRCFFLFLRVLRCFSSPGVPFLAYVFSKECLEFFQAGFPIRKSPDQCLLAAPRGVSALAPSFIGSWCLGIHPMPLLA